MKFWCCVLVINTVFTLGNFHRRAVAQEPMYYDCKPFGTDFNVIHWCTKVIESQKHSSEIKADAYYYRAQVYSYMKKYDRAFADLSKAIELVPHYFKAIQKKAEIYLKHKDYEKAIVEFSKVIKLQPNFSFSYNYRGYAYYSTKQYNLAIKDYDRFFGLSNLANLSIKPDFVKRAYARAFFIRGQSYLRIGSKASAVSDFHQASELAPDNAEYKEYAKELEK